MNRFDSVLHQHHVPLHRSRPTILQVNVGKLCNLTCTHCHVNAGPKRKEIMTAETVNRILAWLRDRGAPAGVDTLDLTGGAPEMIPDFRRFIAEARAILPEGRIIDRCNLTILLEPGFEGTAEFLREQRVEIVASMPCYSPKNVNEQRGNGVFDASITALQLLNSSRLRTRSGRPAAHLVYNPVGAFLPGDQAELEADYKRELKEHFGIDFHSLFTITNMPVSRYASWLRHNGQYESYLELLVDSFNPASVEGLMCRNTINVGWRGEVFDCDFNQQLKMQLRGGPANEAAPPVESRLPKAWPRCRFLPAPTASAAPPALARHAAARSSRSPPDCPPDFPSQTLPTSCPRTSPLLLVAAAAFALPGARPGEDRHPIRLHPQLRELGRRHRALPKRVRRARAARHEGLLRHDGRAREGAGQPAG